MSEMTPGKQRGVVDIPQAMSNRLTINTNLDTSVIITTRDKVDNVLHVYLPLYRRAFAWYGPLSVMVTLWITLFTADFKKVFGVDPSVYFGVFTAAAIGSSLWLIVVLIRSIKRVKQKRILDEIANTHDPKKEGPLRGELL